MDSKRLFEIAYKIAVKNNLIKIPFPKQPFNNLNEKKFIQEVENFIVYPEYSYLNKDLKKIKEVSIINLDKYFLSKKIN